MADVLKQMVSVANQTSFVKGSIHTMASQVLSGKESTWACRSYRQCGFDSSVGKIQWRRRWQHTPVFLPGKFHGQRSPADYSPKGCRVGHNWVTERACSRCHSLVNSEEKTQAQLWGEAVHFLYNSTARVKYIIPFFKQKEKYKGLYN